MEELNESTLTGRGVVGGVGVGLSDICVDGFPFCKVSAVSGVGDRVI